MSAALSCPERSGAVVPLVPRENAVAARDIAETELDAVAALLHEGFPSKTAACFRAALEVLGAQRPVDGLPRYGHVLRAGGELVGVLLVIGSQGADGAMRANVAGWYVRPRYRLYGGLLVLRSARSAAVTQINVSPADHTLRTITSQGFVPLCAGAFAGVPALCPPVAGARIRTVSEDADGLGEVADDVRGLLVDHAGYGCISLVCTLGGVAHPFVFRRRRIARVPVPCAQLIYCRSLDELSRCAGPVGRYLARRGLPWVMASANGPVDAIPGRYFPGKMPVYVKGKVLPGIGDLSYTETALFGF